jgi:hypothetical protein
MVFGKKVSTHARGTSSITMNLLKMPVFKPAPPAPFFLLLLSVTSPLYVIYKMFSPNYKCFYISV